MHYFQNNPVKFGQVPIESNDNGIEEVVIRFLALWKHLRGYSASQSSGTPYLLGLAHDAKPSI